MADGNNYQSDLPDSKKDDAEAACGASELSLKYTTDPNATCVVISN